jgi:hypothetical protein
MRRNNSGRSETNWSVGNQIRARRDVLEGGDVDWSAASWT